MKKISITIPDELQDKFYSMVPVRTRSKFVRAVLKEALEIKERQDAFNEITKFLPFKVEQDSVVVLRRLRKSRKTYLDNIN